MSDQTAAGKRVRASTIEGIFYPSEKELLAARIGELLADSQAEQAREEMPVAARAPYGIIVPHAAFDYCGHIAAAAFKAVSGCRAGTVVLIGPVHREQTERIILPQSQLFQTPLGSVPVAEELLVELAGRSPRFLFDDIPHLEEHCLEVQLPFVQHLFPGAEIVPILLGKSTRVLVQTLADVLWELFSNRLGSVLFVISANMSSYLSRDRGRAELERILAWIEQVQWQALAEAAERRTISSCGAGCVAAILHLHSRLRGTVEVLRQGSSLEIVKDPKKVVHYAAVVMKRDGE